MLTQDGVLHGALGVIQVQQELPVQELDVALVVSLLVPPDTLQPGGQGGGGCEPHFVGNVIKALQEFWKEGGKGVRRWAGFRGTLPPKADRGPSAQNLASATPGPLFFISRNSQNYLLKITKHL